jgi:uncharacterized protein (DUF983 family)
MPATIATIPIGTEARPVERGFAVRCPFCGEEDAVRINLADVQAFSCKECEVEWTPEEVEELLANWAKLIAWVRSAPTK